MQILSVLLMSAVTVSQAGSPVTHLTRSDPVLVTAVFDGVTIAVATIGRVRLLGIDAPEIGHAADTSAPFARAARDRLTALILHRWVHLEQESTARDAHRRHLAYVVRDDGLFVNALLVQEGLARVTARAPLVRLHELKRAETDAQRSHRGMWGSTPPPAAGYTPRRAPGRSRAAKLKTKRTTRTRTSTRRPKP